MRKWFVMMFLLFLAGGFVFIPLFPVLLAARAGGGPDLAPWDVLAPSSALAAGTAVAPWVVRRLRRRGEPETRQLSGFLTTSAVLMLLIALSLRQLPACQLWLGVGLTLLLTGLLGLWSLTFACANAYLFAGVLAQLPDRKERLLTYRAGGSLGYVVAGLSLGSVIPIAPKALLLAAAVLALLAIYSRLLPAWHVLNDAHRPEKAVAGLWSLTRQFGWDVALLSLVLPLSARSYEIFACPFLLESGVRWPTAILVSGVVVEAMLLACLPRFLHAQNYHRLFVSSAGWVFVYAGLTSFTVNHSAWSLTPVIACVGLNAVVNTALAVAVGYRVAACDREVAQALLSALSGMGAVAGSIISNLISKLLHARGEFDMWTGFWLISLLIAMIPFCVSVVAEMQVRRGTTAQRTGPHAVGPDDAT